jgi:hypothetical protein
MTASCHINRAPARDWVGPLHLSDRVLSAVVTLSITRFRPLLEGCHQACPRSKTASQCSSPPPPLLLPSFYDHHLLTMAARQSERDAFHRVGTALILRVVMDRLLSFLPAAAPPPPPPPPPLPALEPDRAEDLAIQKAIDEVLEYHLTHRPRNTARNYEPKQAEWRVRPRSRTFVAC